MAGERRIERFRHILLISSFGSFSPVPYGLGASELGYYKSAAGGKDMVVVLLGWERPRLFACRRHQTLTISERLEY
jgi:hypothetical protein